MVNKNFKKSYTDLFIEEYVGITTEREVDEVLSFNNIIISDLESSKIFSWNVNISNLKVFIDRISLRRHEIVCSETYNLQLLLLDNYNMH